MPESISGERAMNGKTDPPSVAIVGRPNVGKSALFNRLVRRKIAIVHDQPGITRDRASALCTAGSRPFLVWDTGGILGPGESELTGQVRRAVEAAVRESDLLLFVVDAKQGLTPVDQDVARMLRKSAKPVVLAINKIDNDKSETLAADFDSLGFEPTILISAEHNRGILDLLDAMDALLRQGGPASQASIETSAGEKPPIPELHPIKVAVVGRPNVGKSSFINAIVQNQRAIVSELPGTTRDAVDISYREDGDDFVFIDTAGIRKRGRHSSSVEVFSVMRAERSIRRADICVLTVDVTSGVTAQDKKIAGLIQEAGKAAIVLMNKFDLVKPKRVSSNQKIKQIVEEARSRLFFLDYAPVLVTSALNGRHNARVFQLIKQIQRAARVRIGTGVLNRLLRSALAANPPPMVKGRRLKLFYVAQASGDFDRPAEGGASFGVLGTGSATPKREVAPPSPPARRSSPFQPPEFVLFVNEPGLLNDTYGRYLEARLRNAEPYIGLPIRITLRARSEKAPHSRAAVRIPKHVRRS